MLYKLLYSIVKEQETSKDELLSRGDTVDEAIRNMCLVKNKCNVSKILTQATKKQIEALRKDEKRIKRMIAEMDRAKQQVIS